MKTLYVTANRTSASIYSEGPRQPFHLVDCLSNPRGRLKEVKMGTDRPGRAFTSASRGLRHALTDHHEHHREIARKFAMTIAQKLDRFVRNNDYDKVVLTASPEVLGLLRCQLSPFVRKHIVIEIAKEFSDRSLKETFSEIKSALSRP